MDGQIDAIAVARSYRARGIQVVQAMMPDEAPPPLQWKRPRGKWEVFKTMWVTDAELNRWEYVWKEKPNLGMITGAISHGIFVLDIDTYKSDWAAQWWAGMLALHNDNARIETPTQRTGGGGTQMLFRAPAGWRPPTGKNTLGIDVRGEGGFAMLPPSLHESGNHYQWLTGLGLEDVEVAEAPDWLCVEIDRLMKKQPDLTEQPVNGNAASQPAHQANVHYLARDAAPGSQTPIGGFKTDGREDYMMRLIWAAIVGARREAPFIDAGGVRELCEKVWSDYLLHTESRLANPPDTLAARLEQEGRGLTLFTQKWRYAMAKWDGEVARAAEKDDPNPDRPREHFPNRKELPRHDPETGEVLEEEQVAEHETNSATSSPVLAFTPYAWIDPAKIPPRQFLYGGHYIRKFLSMDIAPGGVGKSSLVITESVAMVAHRDLLNVLPSERLRVAYWNGEDPMEELQRRVQAVTMHYGLNPDDIVGRLFIDSGRLLPLIIAQQDRKGGPMLNQAIIDAIIASIQANAIDVLIIDPFVASHRVSENDNPAMELVAKAWSHIADVTNCSINLVHHSRKLNGEEVTAESGRGASALHGAARSVRTLNQMTKEEAEKVSVKNRRLYFRVDNGKPNLKPPAEKAEWHQMVGVDFPNGPMGTTGDQIGVVTRWEMVNPMDALTARDLHAVQNAVATRRWRANSQAADWVGKAVAHTLGYVLPEDTGRVKSLVKTWLGTGALTITPGHDDKRKLKEFVEVGKWVELDG